MIENLTEFKKLLKLCRDAGVTDLEFDNIKLKFGEMPEESVNQGDAVDIDQLSAEELAFYSVNGMGPTQ